MIRKMTALQDPELSLKAKGLYYSIICMKRENSGNCSKEMLQEWSRDGSSSIQSGINELKKRGYLNIQEARESGKIQYDWIITK